MESWSQNSKKILLGEILLFFPIQETFVMEKMPLKKLVLV